MIHVSDIKKYERCEKLYALSQIDPRPFVPFVYYNENMKELCKEYFMIQEYFEGKANDDGAIALSALDHYDVLMQARFCYGDIRIKLPLMIREEDAWNVYFTFASVYPKEGEAQTLADTMAVVEKLHIPVHNVYAIHLNEHYVRKGELDIKKLLVISECLYNAKHHANHKIIDLIKRFSRDVFIYPEQLQETLLKEEIPSIRCNACTRGSKCIYYDTCFEQPTSDTSILHLVQSSKKYDLLASGVSQIQDVDAYSIEGTRHQYAQIMAAKLGGLYIDRVAVKHWVQRSIHYPISYLDFEWETYAYPPYDGMKPYDVLAFQYSLHVEDTHGADLRHYEFIGTKDCRVEFMERLLQDMPTQGTILVFNMDGAEKLRLKQLSEQFPQYAIQLMSLCDRMVDLSLPFSTGNIYDNRMIGFFSLKKLVTIFSDYNYKDLEISYGMDAVRAWRLLDNLEDEESEQMKRALFAYCAMDTYAEVLVFHKIKELLEQRGYNEG